MNRQKRSFTVIENNDIKQEINENQGPNKKQYRSNSIGLYLNEKNDINKMDELISVNDTEENESINTSVANNIPYSLLLPPKAIGYVIGKAGNNIREIENSCEVIVKCKKEDDEDNFNISEKVLTIYGKKQNKIKALELILQKSKTIMDFKENDGREAIVIIVPQRSIPILIGQKGSKILELSELSGCEINVHKDVKGIKNQAVIIKSEKTLKIIECIVIIYDFFEQIILNGLLTMNDFPGYNYIKYMTKDTESEIQFSDNESIKSSNMSNNEMNENLQNLSVSKEKNLLLHNLGRKQSTCVIRFVLDVETTAWIIGKSGRHIKEIRSTTGAGAVIIDAPDNIENVKSCDRILTLSGSTECKYKALKLIVEHMEERENNINNPMRMLVPGKAASFLIGRKGSIIKYITKISGSVIQVAKNSKNINNEKLVLISGTPKSKILASILVLQKLEEYENPMISKEGLLIPLNDINDSKNNVKKNVYRKRSNTNFESDMKNMNRNKNDINRNTSNQNSNNSNNSLNRNVYKNNSSNRNVNNFKDRMDNVNYKYDLKKNISTQNNIQKNNLFYDIQKEKEKEFLNYLYKFIPPSSLSKILSIQDPFTIELNLPEIYLNTLASQNTTIQQVIEEISNKLNCNISYSTDAFSSSGSYTFNLSITGSPISNSLAVLMIQAKIFNFDCF